MIELILFVVCFSILYVFGGAVLALLAGAIIEEHLIFRHVKQGRK